MVQVHSVPWRASRRSATSSDVQRGQDAWRGKVTVPQRRHSDPMSRGSSARAGDQSPSATGTKSSAEHPGPWRTRGRACERPCSGACARRRRAAATQRKVPMRSPLVVPARLAERELDVVLGSAPHDVVRPARRVAGVGEPAQLLDPTEELAALAIRSGRPLDRELARRRPRAPAQLCGSLPSRRSKYRSKNVMPPSAAGSRRRARRPPWRARDPCRSRRSAAGRWSRPAGTTARCCCRARGSRGSAAVGRVSGIAPERIAAARNEAHTNSSSRRRARAVCRASSSRGEPLRADQQPLLGDEQPVAQHLLRRQVEQSCSTAASALSGSSASVV